MKMGECIFSSPSLLCFYSSDFVTYPDAIDLMMYAVDRVASKKQSNILWFLEHDHLYTAGASASSQDLIVTPNCYMYNTDRGGKYTYHGPGQLIVYMIIDLQSLYNGKPDIKKFIATICQWLIIALREFGVECVSGQEDIGIWCDQKKIASIGLKLKKWITYHGIAINLNPDLSYFSYINPCGLRSNMISSLELLGYKISLQDLVVSLIRNFPLVFGV